MKEFVKKLIGRLENRIKYNELCHKEFPNAKMSLTYEVQINAYKNAIEIVKELAEEYNNGWISVSERLPSKEGEYLTFVEYDDDEFIAIDEFLCEGILKEWNCTPNYRVIAWMELPEKYKEKKNGSS